MLTTIRDDTWNMQHITPNSKRWDYSNIPGDGHNKIKGPTHMQKVATTSEKPPPPTHVYWASHPDYEEDMYR